MPLADIVEEPVLAGGLVEVEAGLPVLLPSSVAARPREVAPLARRRVADEVLLRLNAADAEKRETAAV
jgi:hypothetical protein